MGKILVIKGADFSTVSVGKVKLVADKYDINVVANNNEYGYTTGTGNYTEGTTVTITAVANFGYKFSQWDDGDTNATRTITVSEDKTTYIAIFIDINLFNKNAEGYTIGRYFASNGVLHQNPIYYVTNYIPFTSGKLIFNDVCQTPPGSACEAGYDEDKKFVKCIPATTINESVLQYSEFDDTTIKYVRISFTINGEHTIDDIRIISED